MLTQVYEVATPAEAEAISAIGVDISAIAAITLLIAPPFAALTDAMLRRFATSDQRAADNFDGTNASVLVIGFGRFGQIVAQYLLAEDVDVTIIDLDPEMIRVAGSFGFKVYYGDGTRLDVLRAAGLGRARLIAICTSGEGATNRIVELTRTEFPGTKIFARSYDRGHTLQLLAHEVDYELRETFESAMSFGRETLVAIGIRVDRAAIVEDFLRTRDRDRLTVQQAEGIYGGLDLLRTRPTPTPLSVVQHDAQALNMEAAELIGRVGEETTG
ncbi:MULTISPECIES: NAD-binding protein [Bradyrhizobium]|uniref:NAD-binding protein n=1 Tax=Bradyrhizobium TaxID=374 RepID=UPI00137478A1|nr:MULTISPECIES: NAD-binding protein [Bradyrhizobium]